MKKTYRKLVNILSKKFDERKLETMLKYVDESRLHEYSLILKNQLQYLRVTREINTSCDMDIWFWMEVAKQVLDKTYVLHEIIGVQPMTGPVGLVGFFAYKGSLGTSFELRYENAGIEAQVRKLGTSAPVGTLTDCKPMFGISLQDELISLLSSEIACEIIEHSVSNLAKLASPFRSETWPISLTDEHPTHKIPNCTFTLNSACSRIAQASRRGPGNFIIVSLSDAIKLKKLSGFEHSGVDGDGLHHYGTVEKYKIYVADCLQNQIIVGYKGSNVDTGYIYTPYVPIISMGIAEIDTNKTILRLATRGGHWALPSAKDRLCDVSSYYVSLQTQESTK